jgi:pimeloyl-ACP methyl ester carboxylesterase
MIGDFEHVFIDGTVRLHALVKGEGPLVLMCHGFPGLSYSFRHQLRALAEAGFRAVALDMRGYGRSDRPLEVEAYQAAHVESDLVATLAHFGEERAFLVGHDFGARAVLGFSLRHPSRVRGVVSLAVPYGVQYRGARSKEKTAPRKPSEVYAEIAKNHFFHMHYFQAKGPAEAELGARPREFLERIHWALSAEGRLLDWTQFPSEGTGYLDVLAEPARPLPWGWLSEADLDYVVAEYTRVGGDATFVGGLNSFGRTTPTTAGRRSRCRCSSSRASAIRCARSSPIGASTRCGSARRSSSTCAGSRAPGTSCSRRSRKRRTASSSRSSPRSLDHSSAAWAASSASVT